MADTAVCPRCARLVPNNVGARSLAALQVDEDLARSRLRGMKLVIFYLMLLLLKAPTYFRRVQIHHFGGDLAGFIVDTCFVLLRDIYLRGHCEQL